MLELGARRSPASTAAGIDAALVADLAQNRALLYDKTGEEHYNLISALHKSMRNSDPDAAVYWLARMLEAGEDPLYIARRLVRFASEDIGNADPQALVDRDRGEGRRPLHRHAGRQHRAGAGGDLLAVARQEQRRLSRLPRSRRSRRDTEVAEPVPLHLRNAPTRLMKDLDYGKGYRTRTTRRRGSRPTWTACRRPIAGRRFYQPTERGLETEIKRKLDSIRKQTRTSSRQRMTMT